MRIPVRTTAFLYQGIVSGGMRTAVVFMAVLMFAGVASAQAVNQVDLEQETDPGLVAPGNPFYGAEVAVEGALAGTGLVDKGQIASERASEMVHAHERNNTEGLEQARQSMNRIAERATERNREGLQRAEDILSGLQAEIGNEKYEGGIGKAIESVRDAKERVPETGQGETGSDQGSNPSGNSPL